VKGVFDRTIGPARRTADWLALGMMAAVSTSVSAQSASVDYLLCSPQLPGGSQLPGYEDCIELLAWSWGATNVVNIGGQTGGSGAGRPEIDGLKVVKTVDGVTPQLFGSLTTGQHLPELTLTTLVNGRRTLEIGLTTAFFDAQVLGGRAAQSGADTESLTIRFERVQIDYYGVDDRGNETVTSSSWNLATNQAN